MPDSAVRAPRGGDAQAAGPGTAAATRMTATLDALRRDGYAVVRGLADHGLVARLRARALAQLAQADAPLEFEAQLGYPGAPASREAEGGGTVRRLLDAWSRDAAWRDWATQAFVRDAMHAYFGAPAMLSLAHHNCIMTKHPRYGSLTGWHRDFRYWSFERDDMVSFWLALGPERADNGGLHLIPGSHRAALDASRFDAMKFLREDLPDNQALIARAVAPELAPGDALLFHCNTLHAAGRNQGDAVKLSAVFTYHAADNHPQPGTRSAAKGVVPLRASRAPQGDGPAEPDPPCPGSAAGA